MSIPEEFSRFPAHWDVLPFTKAVKDATSGNIKIQTSDYLEDGTMPIVDQGLSHYGGFTDDKSTACKSELPTIVFGDHTRVFKYIEEPFALGADGAKVLEPLVKLDKRFLFHYLKQLKIESAGYSRHYKYLKETYVPIPPPAEQQRIAALLDKADTIRQKREQAIVLAQDFLRSVFLDMFGDPITNPKGWDKKPLGRVFKLSSGNGLTAKEMDADGRYPVYGGNGISGLHSVYMFDSPQLIIGRVGIYCGAIHITEPRAWVTDNALYVKEYLCKININYLAQLLEILNLNQFAGRAAQPLVSGSRIYPIEAILPPIEEQVKFEEIKRAFTNSLSKNLSSKAEIDVFFNTLSRHAFSGQL